MDYTEALMNLIMVLGFVLVFSPKTSYIYANTTEKHQKFYRGIGIIVLSGELHHMFLNNLNRAS